MTERNGRLTVGFLGPLVVSVGGRPIELGQRRLRALVVMLALSAGRAVSVDRLAVAVWGMTSRSMSAAACRTVCGGCAAGWVADTVNPTSAEAIGQLRALGLRPVLSPLRPPT